MHLGDEFQHARRPQRAVDARHVHAQRSQEVRHLGRPAPAVVTPSLPNVTSATTGRSVVLRAAWTATANSSRSEKVSKINRSAPASQSTPICSVKVAAVSSWRSLPPERARLPSGPTEPAIQAACPLISRASRASLTPRKLISLTLSASPYSIRRSRLPPNVLVWMISAPALI